MNWVTIGRTRTERVVGSAGLSGGLLEKNGDFEGELARKAVRLSTRASAPCAALSIGEIRAGIRPDFPHSIC